MYGKNVCNLFFKTRKRKLFSLTLVIALFFYIFAPYILVYIGTTVLLRARHSTGGGAIDLPVGHMIIGEPLIWLGHHISSRGTLWMLAHGNEMEKKFALHILNRWPHKGDVSTLISNYETEKNPSIRDRIIYAIGSCKNNKALPFLEKLFNNGNSSSLIAICQIQSSAAEKKLLEIYQDTTNLKIRKIILEVGNHSLNFIKTTILTENSPKMRLDAFWSYFASYDNEFHKKNKDGLCPLYEAFSDGSRYESLSTSDLIKIFEKHPELSLDDKKFLLLGHAVLRNPKSIPFLKKISTQSKSEPLRKLAKEILKVIPEK